jgi:hypothetical protein
MLNYWMDNNRIENFSGLTLIENIKKRMSGPFKKEPFVPNMQRTYPCAEHNIVKVIKRHPKSILCWPSPP